MAVVALALPPVSAEAVWSAGGPGGAVVVTGDGDDDYVEGNIYLGGSMTWNVFNTNGQSHGAMTNGCIANGAQLWDCYGVSSMTFNSGGGADDIRILKEAGNTVPFTANLGSGNDSIRGLDGLGPSALDGGTGTDVWRIQNSSTDVWDIDLAAGAADGSVSAALTSLVNIENLTVDSGPAPAAPGHILKGNADPNTIDAPSSNDTINGRAGADVILARGGDDVVTGGPGNDSIDCGPGLNDVLVDEEPGDNVSNCEISGAPPIEVNVNTDEADLDLDDGNCDVDAEEAGDQCTLRAAIDVANSQSGPDVIIFNIPSGEAKFNPQASFSQITEAVQIEGSTQPGTPVGEPGVIIDGSQIGNRKRGGLAGALMRIRSGQGTTLESLGFTGGISTAISVEADASLTRIEGVFVGLTESFNAATLAPNALDGIRVEGADTLIRDSIISGNGRYGVHITGQGARLTKLINNSIGPLGPSTGLPVLTGPVTNQGAGVAITDGAAENVIGGAAPTDGNEIGRNGVGVLLDDAGEGNDVLSNAIGATHENGAAVELLANQGAGVEVVDTLLRDNKAATELATNTVANNGGDGLKVTDSSGLEVSGNAVGALMSDTDCTHVLIDNALRPIDVETAKSLLDKQAQHAKRAAVLGGMSVGGRLGDVLERLGGNLICDENGDSIGIAGAITAQIDANVADVGYSLENLAGAFRDNVITASDAAGVELGKRTTVELLGNLFESVEGRPIEFSKGTTQIPPDPLDADRGPNGIQNFGFLGTYGPAATPGAFLSRISMWGAKNQRYRIDYYGSENCTPTGQSDVRSYLGSETFRTGRSGYSTDILEDLPAPQQGYAQATVTELQRGYDPTSELSPCVPIIPEGSSGFGMVPKSPYVKRRKLSAVADCIGAPACTGEAEITSPDGTTSYGTADLDVAAGDEERVKIRITGALNREIKRHKKVDVLLTSTTDQIRTTPLRLRAR